jgi:beta-N-acetylhexosaminidase
MHGKPHPLSLAKLHEHPQFVKAQAEVATIGMESPELPLG